jgi:predicted AAA+ superfamily ATPase
MPVVVLTGMRQVGKTTLLRNEEFLAGRHYVTLDDFAQAAAAQSAPEELLGSRPLTVDEVQREPLLLDAIKSAVDAHRHPGDFVLSGSANLLLLERVAESLAGRAVYLELWPMTRREIEGSTSTPWLVELLEAGEFPPARVVSHLEKGEVRAGGMPPVVVDRVDPEIWFQGFAQTYLERDVRSLAQVADLSSFGRFLRVLALRTGSLLNVSEAGRDAGLSATTASRYLGVLEASFSVFRLPPFLGNRASRIVKSPKLYVSDAGLAHHLIGPRGDAGAGDPFAGQLLETYIAHNLRGLFAAWLPRAALGFWNVQGRHEVDFVVEYGDRVAAIEVKRGTRWTKHDLRGLRRFVDATPSCFAALLACGVSEPVHLDERLWAVPLGLLLA